MPHLNCKICGADFYAKPRHLKCGWGKYCSKPCQYKAQFTGETVFCANCNKKVYRMKKDLCRSKSKNFFCNKSCLAIWKNKHIISGERHVNWKYGRNAYRNIMIRSHIPQICKRCGLNDKRVLIVHHIDLNRNNNIIQNLKWLCRNCHYLEHEGKTV